MSSSLPRTIRDEAPVRDGRAPRRFGPVGRPAPVSAAFSLALALTFGAGEAAAQICSGTLTTGHTGSIWCDRSGTAANLHIDLRDPAISTTSTAGFGAGARHQGAARRVDIDVTGGSITTTGQQAYGIVGWYAGATGAIDVVMRNVDVKTGGFNAFGVVTISQGTGAVPMSIDIEGGSVETTSFPSHAVIGWRQRGAGDVSIKLRDVDVRTTNTGTAHAVIAQHAGTAGNVIVDVRGGSIETFGQQAFGVFGRATSTSGDNRVSVADTSIVTRGRFARAVAATHEGAGDVAVDVSGDTTATSEGEGGEGVYAINAGSGDVGVTVGADVAIKAPFDTGIYGHQSRSTGVPGRVVITSGARIEALNSGILAWVEPRSGHTFGDGGVATGGGDVTQPMIHITSSGDIAVGAELRDAHIRAAVAGDDGTLQAAEQAVLDAILADDSDALDAALTALPATYTDAWKARARGFRAARAATPTDATSHVGGADPGTPAQAQAYEAAAEILQLPRTGIRAMALSHTAIANFIRQSDTDPAIIAIAAASRTAEQRAALAAQHMLSAPERRVLAAVLDADRRGDLETALAALPVDAVSPDAWKDAIRRFALGYSTGDIRVDVTGGSVVSEGDGVHARYAMMHDRNGAVAVTVADGASVSGGRHGLYLGAAGLAEGGEQRDQTVTVDGAVTGGTGAGVHLAGGGTVTVGRTGRIGATSGVGILSDGAGNLVATVAGTVEGDVRAMGGGDLDATVTGTVEGDLRAEDGGALTLDVREGGTVTGTVHDPAGPLTVAGSVGRLLYTNGGTVTVAGTGRLTGVEGEAIRSEAGNLAVTVAGTVEGDIRAQGGGNLDATVTGTVGGDLRAEGGDLAVTVAGTVEGDIRAMGGGDLDATVAGTVGGDLRAEGGGALTVDVKEGGTVTGTVHDAGPMAVAGSVGRLLYANGGTVTVAGTGRLTGVEGEAIRSEAGDLAVDLAGTVTGNIRGMGSGALRAAVTGTLRGDLVEEGAGDLSATISGTVEGDVFGRGTGEHTVTVSDGGTVRGTIHLSASTVTVDGTAGRVRFDAGGTVTVGGTGRITGVEGIAVRNEAGALNLTVGTGGGIEGDIVDLGARPARITAASGGTITGTIDVAGAGSTVTVGGTAGHVRLGDGGTVTVAGTGRLTGVEGEAIRSEAGDLAVDLAGTVTGNVRGMGGGALRAAVTGTLRGNLIEEGAGDLHATISGTVEGNVFGRGAGEHTVTVSGGGTVRGTIHLAASTVTVDGTAGHVRFDNGGTVTVGGTGRITGVEGVAVRNEADALNLTVEAGGRIEGSVVDLGARPARITAAPGGTVTGTIDVAGAGSTVAVGGTAGRVRLGDGGTVMIGANGRITGIGNQAIASTQGELTVVIDQGSDETRAAALSRGVQGAIVEQGGDGVPAVLTREEGEDARPLGPPGTAYSAPDGARDIGVRRAADGFRVVREYAPRSRLYEALPSVLLGLNGPSAFGDGLVGPRSSGGVWALAEAEGGKRAAKRSTSAAAVSWDYRRRGVRWGLDVPLGSDVVVGVSAHHRRGSAELSGREGEIKASGDGLGVSAAWGSGDGFYVDGRTSGTWYDIDLKSSSRGTLKSGARGFGYVLGVEAGRRLGVGGTTVTPRAGVIRSRIHVKGFTDGVGSRVSLEKGGSTTGRAGVGLETGGASGSRLFGSVDVEREFSGGTHVMVSGTGLSSEAHSTRVRVALGGSHEWGGGRYAARGGASYTGGARGNRSYGATLNFDVRF